jgi:flagellar hook-length control protein FliK
VSVPSVVSEPSAMPPARPLPTNSSTASAADGGAAAPPFAALLEGAEFPAFAPPAAGVMIAAATPALENKDACDCNKANGSREAHRTTGLQIAAEAKQITGVLKTSEVEPTARPTQASGTEEVPGAQPIPSQQETPQTEQAALLMPEPHRQDADSTFEIRIAKDGQGSENRTLAEIGAPQANDDTSVEPDHPTASRSTGNTDTQVENIAPFLVTPAGVTVLAPLAAAVAHAPQPVDLAAADMLPHLDKVVALQTAAGNATPPVNTPPQAPDSVTSVVPTGTAAAGQAHPPATPQDKPAGGNLHADQTGKSNEPDQPARLAHAQREAGGQVPAAGDTAAPIRGGAETVQHLALHAPVVHAGAALTSNAASAPAIAPAAAPLAPVPFEGLAVEIATRAHAGIRRFEIRLDPPELGRIDVRLDVDRDGNVASRLVVDRPETLDLLRRDSAQIERALQEAGLKTSGNALEFSLRQQSFAREEVAAQNFTQLVVPEHDPDPLEALRHGYGRLLGLGGGLDIRV